MIPTKKERKAHISLEWCSNELFDHFNVKESKTNESDLQKAEKL